MNELDDLDGVIADALRTRANRLPAVPPGIADIHRRITRRRRRNARLGAFAIAAPALGVLALTVSRTGHHVSTGTSTPSALSTTPAPATPVNTAGAYRCTGLNGDDGTYWYFDHCEPTPTNSTSPTNTPTSADSTTTTIVLSIPVTDTAASRILIIDASGIPGAGQRALGALAARIPNPIELISANRVSEHTEVDSVGGDQALPAEIAAILGLGSNAPTRPYVSSDWGTDDLPTPAAAVIIGQDFGGLRSPITVCPRGSYTVQSGDTPTIVAAKFDTTLAELAAANANTTGYDTFYAGLVITIPAKPSC